MESSEVPPPETGAVADYLKSRPLSCYHIEFGISRSNRVAISWRSSKFGCVEAPPPWDGGMAEP